MLAVLASVQTRHAESVRESIPHLVVTAEADGSAPDPRQLIAEPDGLPARWRWAAAAAVVAIGASVFGWSIYNGYGPDTSGRQTCEVQASIVESDEHRREWFADRCVDAVRTGGR